MIYKKIDIDIKATLSLREASVFSDQGLMQNSWLPKRTSNGSGLSPY